MSSFRRNQQRRNAARGEGLSAVAGGLSILSNPVGFLSGALGSVASSMVPRAVTHAGESLARWYYERQYVKSYGAIAGPLILGATTISLSQAGQIMNIAKAVSKILWRKDGSQPISPGTQQKYEYAPILVEGKSYDWETIATALSLISLKLPDIQSRSVAGYKTPVVSASRFGKLYLLFRMLKWLGVTWWNRVKSPIGAVVSTALITTTLESGPLSSSQARQVFVDLPLVLSGITENHSHGKSARDRNGSGNTAALMALQLGLEPYFVQQSLSDVRKGRDGDRSYHWAKDLGVPAKEFHFDAAKHASILVDVDEHMDMPHFLASNPGVHFVCTFQPTESARGEGEYTFRFLADGQVEYRVSGGAVFNHHIWHYDGDTIIVEDKSFLTKTVVAYHMDRKAIDDHHVIIMLTLLGKFVIPTGLPSSAVIAGTALKRLNPICGNHVVIDAVKPDGLQRSVAIIGSHSCVTLPKTSFDAVHAVAIVAKVAITPGMVDSNISPPGENGMPKFRLGPGQAAIVASYLRDGVPLFPPTVCPPSACVIPIYYDKNGHDSQVPLAGFGSPLIGPNYAHASDIATDDRCIRGRLEAFTGRIVEKNIPPTLAKYMEEFAHFVVPDNLAHTGRPVDHESVHDRQERPSQRHILDQAESSGPWFKKVFRAFVKKEPYGKVTDPRNITTVAPEAKLLNSRYMYAFHDTVMKQLKHYAFNKTPKEIAEFVTQLLRDAPASVIADGSRFDGHVTRVARVLERVIMFRYFHPDCYSELNETMDQQIGLPGTTREGRKYNSAFTRGSGTLETADFNSLLSMFIGYCAWRNTVVDGVKCGPEKAWGSLGIYGGDDSLEGPVDPAALKRSAEMMGQDYEIEVYPRGKAGVNFLNRQFGPDVWTGDCNSMAAPKRLLSKLWIGPAQLNNPIERFAERISGYYRMDRNSPVIGKICMVAHELLGERTGGVLAPWDGKHSLESNWPNEDSGWMMDLFLKDIPDFDMDRFEDWIGNMWYTRDASLLLQAPLCTPPTAVSEVKQPCVVDEEMLVPASPVDVKKDKEEANEASPTSETSDDSSCPLRCDCCMKPVESAPAVVIAANKAVPHVNKKGVKKTVQFTKAKALKKDDDFDPKRPDLWTPPKDAARLADWKSHRAKVAKRLGIKLV